MNVGDVGDAGWWTPIAITQPVRLSGAAWIGTSIVSSTKLTKWEGWRSFATKIQTVSRTGRLNLYVLVENKTTASRRCRTLEVADVGFDSVASFDEDAHTVTLDAGDE
ncbi:hypothetical protein AB5N19_01184 [Seiridium cardinale]